MRKNYFYVRSIIFLGLAAIVFFPVISEGVKNSNQSDNTIECCIEDADINETGINKSVKWNYIGNCLYNLKKYPEAIKAYDNAIMVDHNLDAWNNRGDALYYNKSYAEAEKSYNNNSTLQNNLSQKVWYGKGKSLIRQNKIVEADVLYEEFREYYPLKSKYDLLIFIFITYLIILIPIYYEKSIFNIIKKRSIGNVLGFPQLSDGRSTTFGSIDSMLDKFRCIQSSKLSTLFWFSPWLFLLCSLVIYYKHDFDILASFWLITDASCAFIFNYMIPIIPKALAALWDRNVFENERRITLETDFKKFIYMFELKLNSLTGFFLGAAFGITGVFLDYMYYKNYMKNSPSFSTVLCVFFKIDAEFHVRIVTLFIVFFAGAILGLLAWRVIVIGWCVRLLTEWFDLDPKFGHPDGCGGLSPLGNICLLNALMIGIFSSSLGLSIMAIETTWLRWYYDFLLDLLIYFLSISLAIAIVAFFWPVWNVHEIMKNKRYKILKRINSFSREIEKEKQNMFEDDVSINLDILKQRIAKLETLGKAYEINSQLREWPFDSNTVKTFLSSIIIPIMSFTGLGEWLINILHELLP